LNDGGRRRDDFEFIKVQVPPRLEAGRPGTVGRYAKVVFRGIWMVQFDVTGERGPADEEIVERKKEKKRQKFAQAGLSTRAIERLFTEAGFFRGPSSKGFNFLSEQKKNVDQAATSARPVFRSISICSAQPTGFTSRLRRPDSYIVLTPRPSQAARRSTETCATPYYLKLPDRPGHRRIKKYSDLI